MIKKINEIRKLAYDAANAPAEHGLADETMNSINDIIELCDELTEDLVNEKCNYPAPQPWPTGPFAPMQNPLPIQPPAPWWELGKIYC